MAASDPVNNSKKLRVFLIPFFASGHMIPMADLAVLISRHDVDPTLCLTKANADFLRPTLPSSVNVLLYPFPAHEAGLPPGQENLSTIPPDQEWKLYRALDLCQPAHRHLLHTHHPDAVIADGPFWRTIHIAADLSIPAITWHAIGVFPLVVMNSLYSQKGDIINKVDNNALVVIKNLPDQFIKMRVSELPELVRSADNPLSNAWKKMKKAQMESYGAVVNTFYEIEPAYCDQYKATDCQRAWFVGPVALARGEKEKRRHECLEWLDGQEESSVVYTCFGSWCQFKDEQLREMALGFEKSGHSFLWVVRNSEGEWMPDEGWMTRVDGRGMVVQGWAPQVDILAHKSVGAFFTHCGWNSVLESTTAGVPMLTWPLVFEQFINEMLVVEVLGTGARVSREGRSTREEEKVVVPAKTIAEAVRLFMETEGSQGGRRAATRKYAERARAAVGEGGSSWNNLAHLIDSLKLLRDNKLEVTT